MKQIKLLGLTTIFFSVIACGQTTQKNGKHPANYVFTVC